MPLIVSMVLSSNLSAQMSQSGTTVINLAGKQRMLTQKMSKEALLIIKGIEVEKNRADLQKTITLFDKPYMDFVMGMRRWAYPRLKILKF